MASHFKWYPSETEVVVPFNARYSFPSQANKAIKMTPRIPPKNSTEFSPGNVIRLEFPAQGYINPGKTTLEFDVEMRYDPLDSEFSYLRFQNNIQSIFSRARLLYGATPIEDIPGYNVIVRALTEWTSSNNQGIMDQASLAEGIGGTTRGASGQFQNGGSVDLAVNTGSGVTTNVNVRQKYIQGIDFIERFTANASLLATTPAVINKFDTGLASGYGIVPNTTENPSVQIIPVATATTIALHASVKGKYPVRRYQVQLALGMFNQEKLIPTKFMASQLALELTLENPAACMYYVKSSLLSGLAPNSTLGVAQTTTPTYRVKNVNLIPEILEFDASYDASFLKGLQSGGVPIKFATWNNFRFGASSSLTSLNLQIQERSRSVKAIFAMQRRDPPDFAFDSGASFFNTDESTADGGSTLQEFQFRIGGRYFPAQPVQCSTEVGNDKSNGGAEAYIELAKALNTLGDYRLSCPVNAIRWAVNPGALYTAADGAAHTIFPEYDYDYALVRYKPTGAPVLNKTYAVPTAVSGTTPTTLADGQAVAGDCGSGCFAMAIDLETSNGLEISGLNASEQSDISLIARYSKGQKSGFIFDVYTYIDSMIVLRENNVMELIQ